MSSPSCEGDEYQCVVCLSEWDSCETVAGVDTEEECERLVACEMPGGGMRYFFVVVDLFFLLSLTLSYS